MMYRLSRSPNRVQHLVLKHFRRSLRGCSGPQSFRCAAEVSAYKRNTLRQHCQEKMINYKAVEGKSMCCCVQLGGGNGVQDNKSGSCKVQQGG